MDANAILTANILDIVFDGKNKAYGAYDLRKNYNNRMLIALLITAGVILFVFIAESILYALHPAVNGGFTPPEIILKPVPKEETKKEKPKVKPQVKVATVQYTNVKIVKNIDVPPPTMDNVYNAVIDVITKEGVKDSGNKRQPLITGSNVIENVESNSDDGFGPVEIDAEFPGGSMAWKKYLQNNLNADVPGDNDAPSGTYTVVVKFVVGKDGEVSEIQCENDPGYGMGEEAKEIIRKGPKWKPALQNGRNVKAYRRQPILFVVE